MGAVSMSSCHLYGLRLCLFGLVQVGLMSAASAAPPPTIQRREAGFYTTRFGRSDPAMTQARLQELKSRSSGPNLPDRDGWRPASGHKEKKMYTTRYGRSDPDMVEEVREQSLDKWQFGQKEKKMYTTRFGRSDPDMMMMMEDQEQSQDLEDEGKWGETGQKEKKMYTTRYGRSDPDMRLPEFQTSYFPEPDPTPSEVEWKDPQYPAAWEYEIDNPEKHQAAKESSAVSPPPCLFSRRWNVLICQVPWYSKRDTRILY